MTTSAETRRAFGELAAAAVLLERLPLPEEPVVGQALCRAWASTASPSQVLDRWRREVLDGRGLPREVVLLARQGSAR